MKRFFRTKLPAVLLALTLMVSMIPMAGALTWTGSKDPTCSHSSYDIVEVGSASCTSSGTRLYACSNQKCGAVAVEIIPATGHSFYRYSYDETSHWRVCSVCGAQDTTSRGTHVDRNDDGRCDVCSMTMRSSSSKGDITYEVSPGGRVNLDEDDFYDFFNENASSGSLRYVIFDRPDSSAFSEGTLYYDYGGRNETTLTRSNLDDGTFYYDGTYDEDLAEYDLDDLTFVADRDFEDDVELSFRAYYSSSRYVDGTVTITTGKSSSNSSKDELVYEVKAGERINLDEDDFYDFFDDNASSGYLKYVIFDRPSSSAFSEGTLYYDYGGKNEIAFSRSTLANGTFYYGGTYDEDLAEYDLDDLTFVADRGFEDDVTLSFRAYYSSSRYVDGTLTFTAGKSSSSSKTNLTYEVAAGGRVNLDEKDFYDFFDQNSSTGSLRYVIFDRPSSSAFSDGTLYYDYGGKNEVAFSRSTLANGTFYYGGSYDEDNAEYDLDDLTFVADRDFEDDVTLSFRAYYSSSRYVDGTLTFTAGKSSSSKADLTYEVAAGGRVNLDEKDFYNFFDKNSSSGSLRYVIFDRPSSSAFSNGTLYYDYGGRDEIAFSRSTLANGTFYYGGSYDEDNAEYDLDNLTFVAGKSFKDDVTLSFRAYYSSSRYVDGTLTFTTGKSSSSKADLTYEVAAGGRVNLDEKDFYNFFDKNSSTGSLRYVIFDRPDTSAFAQGTLYYDYGGKNEVAFSRSTLANGTFYYGGSYDEDNAEYDLDDLTFVAGRNFKDDVTLSFRAYYSSSRYVDGTLTITTGKSASTSTITGEIRYAATYGSRVQINANDIARYFSKSYPGYTLQYVTLGGVPATGSLYYNYYSASRYGTSSSLRLTSSNYNSQVLYFSPVSTAQYALTELTYVPSGNNYCDVIPFTAYGSGSRSISGNILISVNSSTVSEVYGVTQRNTAVSFPASAIYSAVSSATGVSLASIQLLSLPSASQGTVYVGSGSVRATTNTLYTYGSGSQQISQLRFVPVSTFTGSVQIPYVAYNSSGTAIATGLFSLGVLNTAKSFKDVSTSTWCYKYVVELSDANVIDGYSDGSFKPNNTVTYGAALKLIMLAAGYPEQAPVSSNVFSGYLAKARSEGIITRSDVDLSKPITRLQVAQIAAGAMKLDTSNLSSVQPFTDTTDASVRALNAAGIVEGYFSNGTSTYRPNNTLTRGQLSAIVWRMEQYGK